MTSPVKAITDLALRYLEIPPTPIERLGWNQSYGDPIIEELMRSDFIRVHDDPLLLAAQQCLGQDPELESLISKPNETDPMIFSALTGGSRQDLGSTIMALLQNASQALYVLGLEVSETSFVRQVLEFYDELKRVARGEKVRTYSIMGLAGITIDPAVRIVTPWGTIRGVSPTNAQMPVFGGAPRPQTTAVLVSPQLAKMSISREPQPPLPDVDQDLVADYQRNRTLTPLLFALHSVNGDLAAPIVTFETTLVPFLSGNSFSTSFTSNPFVPTSAISTEDQAELENLAKTLADRHHDSLQVASVRTVSAISQRFDKSDALIDAVMAWESLVGTRSEVVYRVTAALTNLLQEDRSQRSQFRKRLGDIYNIRSRVVHGDTVDHSKVVEASDEAIRVALRAMLELYKREGDWLSIESGQRSERLLLGTH